MDFSAVILAGGRSTRMRQDKAFLPWGDGDLLGRQIATAHLAGARQILISGRTGVDYSQYALPVVTDDIPDLGPISGLIAGLRAALFPLLLTLAVDLPHMTPEFLAFLFTRCRPERGVVPQTSRGLEPLAAFVPREVLPLAQRARDEGRLALHELLREAHTQGLVEILPVARRKERLFTNLNAQTSARRS